MQSSEHQRLCCNPLMSWLHSSSYHAAYRAPNCWHPTKSASKLTHICIVVMQVAEELIGLSKGDVGQLLHVLAEMP